jgi:hypothetical protein
MFKVIISSLLPESWDHFTDSYVSGRKGVVKNDPKKLTCSQEFIGILKEEYLRCKVCANNTGSMNQITSPRHFTRNNIETQPVERTSSAHIASMTTTTYRTAES